MYIYIYNIIIYIYIHNIYIYLYYYIIYIYILLLLLLLLSLLLFWGGTIGNWITNVAVLTPHTCAGFQFPENHLAAFSEI